MATKGNGIKKAWSDLNMKVKLVVGIIMILTAFLAVHPYLPEPFSMGQAFASEASDREQADLQTQLDIVEFKIQFYLKMKEADTLSTYDQDRLEMAIKRRDRLIVRLDNILA